jgi:hypothetical protein
LHHRRSAEESLSASNSNLNPSSSSSSAIFQGQQIHSRASSDSLISGPASNHSGLGHGRSSAGGGPGDKFVRTLSLDVSSSSLGLDGTDGMDADGDVSMSMSASMEQATIEQVERRSMNIPLPAIPGGGFGASLSPSLPGVVPFPATGHRSSSTASLPVSLPVVHPQPRPALSSSASADHAAVMGMGSGVDVPPVRPSIRPRAHTMPRTDADDSMSVGVGISGSLSGVGVGGSASASGSGGMNMSVDMDMDARSALDRLMDDVASGSVASAGHADLEDPEQDQEPDQDQEREDEYEQQRHRRHQRRDSGEEEEEERTEEDQDEEEQHLGGERVRDASAVMMEVETTMTTDPETSLRVEVITDGVKAGQFAMPPPHVHRDEEEDEEMMDEDCDEDGLVPDRDGEEEEEEENEAYQPEHVLPPRREMEDAPAPAVAPEHEDDNEEHFDEEQVQNPDDAMMEEAEEEQEEEPEAIISPRRHRHMRAATDTELLMSKPQPPLPQPTPPLPTPPSITIEFPPLDFGESISGAPSPVVGTSSSASFSRPLPPPAPAPPTRDAIKDRHQLIIEKRREARRREEAASGLPRKAGRAGRRRSMSAGDAEGVRARQAAAAVARPESGLDVDGIDNGEALEESINRELQKLGVTNKVRLFFFSEIRIWIFFFGFD